MSVARHVGLAAPLAICLLLALPAFGAPPKAPTNAERAAARDAYDKGTLAFEKGNYVVALDSFVKANAIIPSIQAAYWIAQAHDRLEHAEAALKAYEDLQAREDFSKLSPEKATTVRARITALKSPPPPPPPPPPVESSPPPAPPVQPAPSPEPEPTVVTSETPPPPVSEPPAAPITPAKLLPQGNTVELGITAGALLVTDRNNLVEAGYTNSNFEKPVWELGARAAYFPAKFLGIEAEWTHGFGRTPPVPADPGASRSANFDAVRGHLIGQLPDSQFVPFALLGAGILHGTSKRSGADTDVVLEAGVGAKVFATRLLVPRVDLRLNMTQKQGGGFTDGISVHPELLLGLGFRLGS